MSVTSTLLNAAAQQVELAFQAVLAVPGTNESIADIAFRLEGIRKELEEKLEVSRHSEPLQEQLGFNE